MEIRNSINILFAKFSLNYRVLLYMFLSIAIVLGISVSIIIPSFTAVFRSPETAELFTVLRQQMSEFMSGTASISDFSQAIRAFVDGVKDLLGSSNAPAVFWITFSMMCIFIRFVTSFCFPVISDVVNNFMSSNMNYGFMSNMLKNFKMCFKYACFHTLFTTIIDAAILLAVYGISALLISYINVFALALSLLTGVILISLRLAFSSGVIPAMVVEGETGYFRAFKKSWPNLKKYFKFIFGAYCIACFAMYCLITILSLITFGLAFFVLAAMFVTYIHILQLVFYYGSKNMRYYSDGYTIVNTAPIEDRLDLQEELIRHDDNE